MNINAFKKRAVLLFLFLILQSPPIVKKCDFQGFRRFFRRFFKKVVITFHHSQKSGESFSNGYILDTFGESFRVFWKRLTTHGYILDTCLIFPIFKKWHLYGVKKPKNRMLLFLFCYLFLLLFANLKKMRKNIIFLLFIT